MNFTLGLYYLHKKDDVVDEKEMFIWEVSGTTMLEINTNNFIEETFISWKTDIKQKDGRK